jgi:hypothetical protein
MDERGKPQGPAAGFPRPRAIDCSPYLQHSNSSLTRHELSVE